MPLRRLLPLLILVLTVGCETGQMTPDTSADVRLAEDERRLWQRVQQEHETIENSGFVAQWPEVEAYLNGVLQRLHPAPFRADSPLRIKVVVDPTLNAFVLPNGAMYIHTGLLARLENEAQLAAIISHEVTHATHRHGVKAYRKVKNQTAFLAAFTVGTGGFGGLLGGIGVLASVSGYSQDLEREADRNGFRMMIASGYDPREAPKVFHMFREETKRSKIKEPFFFGSHPKLGERIASYEQLVAELPPDQRSGATHASEYAQILPVVLVENSAVAVRAGDFDFAKNCAERCLALEPEHIGASFQLAETLRRRDQEGDVRAALNRYRAIVERDPSFADAHRGIGLTAMKLGEMTTAAAGFHRYLALRPTADDRAYVEHYLQQCENET